MTEQAASAPYDAFVSYSHSDHQWVWNELMPRLESAGLRVLIDDRDFEIGTPSLVNMERAVERSRHTLAVLTPAWLQSQWTEFESLVLGIADPAGRKRKLVPLMLTPCQPPPRIGIFTYADFTQPRTWERQFARLLAQFGAQVESEVPLEAAPDAPPPIPAPLDSEYLSAAKKRLEGRGFTCEADVMWEEQQFRCIAKKGIVFARIMLLLGEFLTLSDVSFKDYIDRCHRYAAAQKGHFLSRELLCIPIAIVDRIDGNVVNHLRNEAFFEKAGTLVFPVIHDRSSNKLHSFQGFTVYGVFAYPLIRRLLADYLRLDTLPAEA